MIFISQKELKSFKADKSTWINSLHWIYATQIHIPVAVHCSIVVHVYMQHNWSLKLFSNKKLHRNSKPLFDNCWIFLLVRPNSSKHHILSFHCCYIPKKYQYYVQPIKIIQFRINFLTILLTIRKYSKK